MNDNKATTEILDLIEGLVTRYIMKIMKLAGKEINEKQSKNIISKIGLRTQFGKELVDELIVNKIKKDD